MAVPTTIKGQLVTLLFGDGATPTEVFTVLCGLTTKSLARALQTTDTYLEDCADPEALALRVVDAIGESTEISGEGVFNLDQRDELETLFGSSVNYRLKFGTTGYMSLKAVLTQYNITGARGERGTVSITLQSDGSKPVWTPLP